jgi:hypothetical protein
VILIDKLTDDKKHILCCCPGCGGEGLTMKCLEQDDQEGYRDSFQKHEEGHRHKLDVCQMCSGLCFVLVPIEKLNILAFIRANNDTTSDQDGSDPSIP